MRRAVLLGWAVFLLSACRIVGQPEGEVILRVITDTSSVPIIAEMLNEYEESSPGVVFASVSGNEGTTLTVLEAGEADFALLLLPAQTEFPFQIPVSVEALVLVVHPDNPVEMLTIDQARAIFSGRIVNWETVGGRDSSIHVVVREDGSDIRRVFRDTVLGDYPHASVAQIATSNAQVLNVVGSDPQAIGYVTFGSLDDHVMALSLDGVMPSAQTIHDGDYPLTAQIMFVALAEPRGVAGEFLSWSLARD